MSEAILREQEERLNQFYANRGIDRAGVLQAGWTYVTDSHDIEALKKLAETIKKTTGSETNLLFGNDEKQPFAVLFSKSSVPQQPASP